MRDVVGSRCVDELKGSCSDKVARTPSAIAAPTRGIITGFDGCGYPLVDFPNNPIKKPICAFSAVALDNCEPGQEVVLLFDSGDLASPIIIGMIQPPIIVTSDKATPHCCTDVTVDGERIVLTGTREIVLRCGDASISLTRTGKVIIKGRYVSSRSSGVNRVRGAAVHIN